MSGARRGIVPGLGLSLGITLTYLSLVVLLPIAALMVRAAAVGPQGIWAAVTTCVSSGLRQLACSLVR